MLQGAPERVVAKVAREAQRVERAYHPGKEGRQALGRLGGTPAAACVFGLEDVVEGEEERAGQDDEGKCPLATEVGEVGELHFGLWSFKFLISVEDKLHRMGLR